MEIIIRKEEKKDYKDTELMTKRAFWNIHEPGCNEHYLVHILRESEDYLPELSRVAELNGKIIGAILYSKAWIQDGTKKHEIVTFGPLAVDPMAQSLGIGRKLLEATIPLVREAGYPGICMFGEPDYYPKYGFKTSDHFEITDLEGNYSNALLGIETAKGSLSSVKGKFIESKVFELSYDEEKVEAFDSGFPDYPKYKVPSQWLHKQRLGMVVEDKDDVYTIEFWESRIQASIDESFHGERPNVGDLVTFYFVREKGYQILTVEQPLEF